MLRANPVRPDFARALKTEACMTLASARSAGANAVSKISDNPKALFPPILGQRLQCPGYPKDKRMRAFTTRMLETWTGYGHHFGRFKNVPQGFVQYINKVDERLGRQREASYILAQILFPVYSQAGTAVVTDKARNICTSALLKAIEVRQRTGAFPKRIEDIPGTWLDPFNGKRLHVGAPGPEYGFTASAWIWLTTAGRIRESYRPVRKRVGTLFGDTNPGRSSLQWQASQVIVFAEVRKLVN